jgi:hypothetical protein
MSRWPLALAIILAVATPTGPARAQNYPWCAHYTKGGGELNCGFSTWDQCMADVSGIGGFCQANNTYAGPAATNPHRVARRKSHKNS